MQKNIKELTTEQNSIFHIFVCVCTSKAITSKDISQSLTNFRLFSFRVKKRRKDRARIYLYVIIIFSNFFLLLMFGRAIKILFHLRNAYTHKTKPSTTTTIENDSRQQIICGI